MGKPTKKWIELGDYLFYTLKWGDNAVPIMIFCVDNDQSDEIAAEVLEFVKSNPNVTVDEVGDMAQALHEKKYGNPKFVIDNNDN